MTDNVEAFDHWIRGDFARLNTELENRYFDGPDRAATAGIGDELKTELQDTGRRHILALLREGNTDEGFDKGFGLLGNVGLYMAACGRHDIAEDADSPSMRETWALAMQIGASLGVTPRFATSHLTTHNRAINGRCKSFTNLADEHLFTDYNTRGILAYKRAADALLRVLDIGISHPVTVDLLRNARDALLDVVDYNERLFAELDVDRFFFSVRPYFRPHRVGLQVYRGANAGDFAGINVIDLLLGLCQANSPAYAQMLVEKFLYMMPRDQAMLRDCMRRQSLMDAFLRIDTGQQQAHWYRDNLAMFLEVCQAHGRTACQHHDLLVKRFIEVPAAEAGLQERSNLTASGPPLAIMLDSLQKLRDLRTAAQRDDIPSRYRDIGTLRDSLL
jgi:hypothetical protein